MNTHTGTLRGGMMAIGGETTGWMLVSDGATRDGATDGIDLDVSKVLADAKRLDGQRVTVSGRTVDREYVERGRVPMLIVETIEQVK
jgi:hypothetical protein